MTQAAGRAWCCRSLGLELMADGDGAQVESWMNLKAPSLKDELQSLIGQFGLSTILGL